MALFKFTKNILLKNIQVYNYGNHARDFTYIDDIVEGIFNALKSHLKRKKMINLILLITQKVHRPIEY